jgi:hypothetical protein
MFLISKSINNHSLSQYCQNSDNTLSLPSGIPLIKILFFLLFQTGKALQLALDICYKIIKFLIEIIFELLKTINILSEIKHAIALIKKNPNNLSRSGLWHQPEATKPLQPGC